MTIEKVGVEKQELLSELKDRYVRLRERQAVKTAVDLELSEVKKKIDELEAE